MKRQKVVILGGGMIGSAIAMDLSRRGQADVTVADLRADVRERIESRYAVKTVAADLSRPAAITALVEGYDLVVGALPSVLGYQTLEAVIAAGKDYCDISFMPENALELDARAREKGVCAVVDCGVAPGVSNVMAGYAAAHLAPFESLEIYVGGLPRVRRWPFDYKAGFAPFDVIEEYTRPARIVEHGRVVVREALSEAERMDFPGVGTLEAFNTDGLRSLVHTLDVPFMKEKTLRYPGHIELMRAFRELGLFSKDALEVGEATVRPLDVTAALLFPKWTFEEGEADLTVMRVIAQGLQNGRSTRYVWDLLDRFDPETGLRSMSRTTAFPAAIMAGLMLEGAFRRPGVHAPESVGREPGLLDRLLAELEDRGVVCRQSVTVEEPAAAVA
jgi:saccharopine dehydrogenase-like NADP-dependent oxidoreductase